MYRHHRFFGGNTTRMQRMRINFDFEGI